MRRRTREEEERKKEREGETERDGKRDTAGAVKRRQALVEVAATK